MEMRVKSIIFSNNGFTLLELLVVVSIFVVMSALVLTSFPSLRARRQIEAAAQTIINASREARTSSIAVNEYAGTGIFPSYGVNIDMATPDRILIYADCNTDDNNDGIVNDDDTFYFDPSSTDCGGTNGAVKEVFLNSLVRIQSIQTITTGSPVSETQASIEYIRPEPSIWIADSDGNVIPFGRVEITFKDTFNKYQKTVVFWSTGHIETR